MRPRVIQVLALLCLSAGSAFGQFILTSNPNPSTLGQQITLTADPAPSSTTVTFYDGGPTGTVLGTGSNPVGGPVSINVSILSFGQHSLQACYVNQDVPGTTCTNTVNQYVGIAPILNSSPNPSNFGNTVTLAASSVEPGASSVNFFDGGSQIGSSTPVQSPPALGTATFQISTLSVGTHHLTACTVSSNPSFCSNVVVQVVNPVFVNLTLTSSPNPSAFGQAVTLMAAPAPSFTTVTFYDGGSSGGPVIGSGSTGQGSSVTIQVSTLTVGTHQIIACFPNDGTPPVICSNIVSQQVNPSTVPTSLALTSSPNPSSPCQPVTFKASITPNTATGSVTFLDGTATLQTVPLTNGSASLTVPTFSLGTHQIQARYVPDPGFGGSSSALAQTVTASTTVTLSSAPNPSSSGQTVTLTVAVAPVTCPGTAPPTVVPTGTVSFLDGGAQIGQSSLVSGTATFSTSTLSIGSHTLSALYNGDTNYASNSSNTVTQVVNGGKPTTTTLTTSANPITTTQPLTLTASVTGTGPTGPTGSVQFKDGTHVLGTSPLTGGTAALTITSLPAGVHPLIAVYLGDANFNTSTSNTVNETVNSPSATNTTTVLTTSANPITTTQSLTLTAIVTPSGATGQVQFKDGTSTVGTSTLAGGTATLTISNIPAGVHPLTAVYLGDTNFNTSTSNTVNETVNSPNASNTTTVLTTSANPIGIGQPLTLTATVTPSGATGQVQFKDGPTAIGTSPLTGGTAVLTVSNLTVGAHALTAVYLGDANFNTSTSNTVSETVFLPVSNTTLSVSPNPAIAGQPVTLSATVLPANATGAVQFLDGAAVLGQSNLIGGTSTLQVSTLAAGPHSLTAHYLGDTVYPPSTSIAVTLTVNSSTSQPTSTSLTVTPNPANLGQTVTISAVVTPVSGTGPISGTVTFSDNGSAMATAQLLNGTALFTTSTLSGGSHTIVAVYNGSAAFNSSSSTAVTLVVNGTPTRTTLSTSPNPSTFGQAVVFNASVTPVTGGGTPTGTVTFTDGITTLGTVTLTGGGASFSTSDLTAGSHSLVASYSGDSTFSPSSSLPVTQQVNKAATTTALAVSPTSSSPGQSVQLSARVTPSTATGTITFMDGTTAIGAPVTLVGGIASTTTSSLTNGNHSLTAVYSGDANYLGSTSPPVTESVGLTPTTTDLKVNPTSTTYGQPVTLTATVAPAGATGSVTFLDGTATLGSQTLTNGTATFTTSSLSAGSHSLTAVYSGDSLFSTSTSPTVTETVTKGNSTTALTVTPNPASVGQSVTLTATVTPATATGTVAFMDGSTALPSGTLANGSTTVTISTLAAGTHTITAVYAGDGNLNGSTSTAVTEIVNPPCAPLVNISPTSLATAFVGLPYSQTFAVTGGCTPLTWSLAVGSVPGLTLSPAGVLSGTPTTPTTNPISLTIRVQDSANPSQANATVLTLTVLPLPVPTISVNQPANLTDQPAPIVTLSPPYPLALTATFSLSFTPNAANLPANYINPDVRFIGGITTAGPINIPANSTAPIQLPAIQLGTVAGTITVTLTTLATNTGQTVLPANPVTATITIRPLAPTIVPGSVKIINITSTGFSIFLDGSSNTRDLTSASLTFAAAPGSQLNGTQFTVSLTAASTAWFSDTGANRGVANGGAFSLTLPFNYSGDTNAISTVSATVTNSVGTSAAVSGGR